MRRRIRILGRPDEALSLVIKPLSTKYPTDEKLDRAYLNIVDIYRDLGDDAHALEWCQKTETAFPGKTPEALTAIFDRGEDLRLTLRMAERDRPHWTG